MPGTWGTLSSLIILLIPNNIFFISIFTIIILSFLISIPIINNIENEDDFDPSYVVIDEAVGMWFILLFDFILNDLYFLILSIILFRILDIWKPYPISYFNNKKGGLFVMLDDLVAALFTVVLIYFISKLIY